MAYGVWLMGSSNVQRATRNERQKPAELRSRYLLGTLHGALGTLLDVVAPLKKRPEN